MAISFVGSVENSAASGADVSLDLTTISGLQQNDLVIVAYGIGTDVSTDLDMAMITLGYTQVADLFADGTQDGHLGVFYKFMGASPDETAVVDGLGGSPAAVAAVCMAFRGVDTTTPMDVAATTDTGTGSSDPNPPSISHNNPSGVWTVIAGATGLIGSTGAYTFPTGYTTDALDRSQNDSEDVTVGMGYNASPASPENPGLMDHSIDSANSAWCAVTMALRPAVSGITGNLSVTEANDTVSGVATADVASNSSVTEAADTLSGQSALAVAVTGDITDGEDTLSGDASLPVGGLTADLSATEAADTLSGVSTVAVSASATPTEAADTLGSAVEVALFASSSPTEEADSLSGQAVSLLSGATEEADSLSASATISVAGVATLDSTEADDSLAGALSVDVAVALSSDEEGDGLSSSAESGGEAVVPTQVAGGVRRKRRWALPNGMYFYGTWEDAQKFLESREETEPEKPVKKKTEKPRPQPKVDLVEFREPIQEALKLESRVFKQPPPVWPAKIPLPQRDAGGFEEEDSDTCSGEARAYWPSLEAEYLGLRWLLLEEFDRGYAGRLSFAQSQTVNDNDGLVASAEAGFWFPKRQRQEIVIQLSPELVDYIFEEAA